MEAITEFDQSGESDIQSVIQRFTIRRIMIRIFRPFATDRNIDSRKIFCKKTEVCNNRISHIIIYDNSSIFIIIGFNVMNMFRITLSSFERFPRNLFSGKILSKWIFFSGLLFFNRFGYFCINRRIFFFIRRRTILFDFRRCFFLLNFFIHLRIKFFELRLSKEVIELCIACYQNLRDIFHRRIRIGSIQNRFDSKLGHFHTTGNAHSSFVMLINDSLQFLSDAEGIIVCLEVSFKDITFFIKEFVQSKSEAIADLNELVPRGIFFRAFEDSHNFLRMLYLSHERFNIHIESFQPSRNCFGVIDFVIDHNCAPPCYMIIWVGYIHYYDIQFLCQIQKRKFP